MKKRTQRSNIHICPECTSHMVYPTEWHELNESWSLKLRCPGCEWRGKGVWSQEEVEYFDDILNDGTDMLIDACEALSAANFEEYVGMFADALRNDHILAEDF